MAKYKKFVKNYVEMQTNTYLEAIVGIQDQSEIKVDIAKDIERTRFVNFEGKTFEDFKKIWESNKITDYSQGDMDASFFHGIWQKKQDLNNAETDFASTCKPFSFAYINNKGEPCGFSITYHEDFPEKWSVAIIKNTNNPPNKRTVSLYCPEYFQTRNAAQAILDDSTISNDVLLELESDSIRQVLAKVINPDATVNFNEIRRLKGIIKPNKDIDTSKFNIMYYEAVKQQLLTKINSNKKNKHYQKAQEIVERVEALRKDAGIYLVSLTNADLDLLNQVLLNTAEFSESKKPFKSTQYLKNLERFEALEQRMEYMSWVEQFKNHYEVKKITNTKSSELNYLGIIQKFINDNPNFMSKTNLEALTRLVFGTATIKKINQDLRKLTLNNYQAIIDSDKVNISQPYAKKVQDLYKLILNHCQAKIDSHENDIRQPYAKKVLSQVEKIVEKNAQSLCDKDWVLLSQVLLTTVATLDVKNDKTHETSFANLAELGDLSKLVAPLEHKSTLWKKLGNVLEGLYYVCAFTLVVGLIITTCGTATPALLYAIPVIAATSTISKAGTMLERRYNENLSSAILDLRDASSKTRHGGFFTKPKPTEPTNNEAVDIPINSKIK